jgi:hypothetical protein
MKRMQSTWKHRVDYDRICAGATDALEVPGRIAGMDRAPERVGS